jgi:hypothetical protein
VKEYLDYAKASWVELNAAAVEIYTHKDISDAIGLNLLTVGAIDKVISEGWRVQAEQGYVLLGGLDIDHKRMMYRESLTGFERDVTIFHELAHLHHDPLLRSRKSRLDPVDIELLAEWLARRYRSDPALLRQMVVGMGLEAQVYDETSYRALNGVYVQLVMPSFYEGYVMMERCCNTRDNHTDAQR